MCKVKAPPPPKFSDPRQNDPQYQQVGREMGIGSISSADDVYRVEKTIAQRQQDDYNTRLAETERKANEQRAADQNRAEQQFNQAQALQQRQFEQSIAAQQASLQAQLRAQEEMQRRAEEAALRAQVPQMTDGKRTGLRVRPRTSLRQRSRQAALGTNQLRIPLSIGAMGSGSGGASPVKLNIGS